MYQFFDYIRQFRFEVATWRFEEKFGEDEIRGVVRALDVIEAQLELIQKAGLSAKVADITDVENVYEEAVTLVHPETGPKEE